MPSKLCCIWLVLISQVVSNPLDIGAVYSCVVPRSTACTINYSVPESISYLVSIKDAFINGTLSQMATTETSECLDGVRRILCLEEYPQCDSNNRTVSVQLPENCTQLLSSCSKNCDFSVRNVSLGNCKTIMNYAVESNHTFSELSSELLSTLHVTEWMFRYMKKVDAEVHAVLQSQLFTSFNEECKNRYRIFKFGGIGQCWDQGNRIKLIVNQEDCTLFQEQW